jgi:hypothetical protein
MTDPTNTATPLQASSADIKEENERETATLKGDISSRRQVLLGTAVVGAAAAVAGGAEAQTRMSVRGPTDPTPWGEPVALNRMPVVFNFRPDRMVKVSPARLAEWEQLFATNIGIRPGNEAGLGQGETISGSGGATGGWDDCDYTV